MPPLLPSPFPDGQITTLWKVILDQLTQDPLLSRAVREWQVWSGTPDDTTHLDFSQFPALRLTPAQAQWRWSDEQRFDGPLTLRIVLAVQGRRAADLFNFWEAAGRALSRYATSVHDPNQGYFGDWLIQYGCYQVTMTGPAFEPLLTAVAEGLQATGTITFSFNLDA